MLDVAQPDSNKQDSNKQDSNKQDSNKQDSNKTTDTLEKLACNLSIRTLYTKHYSSYQDKRTISNIKLSEGQAVLDRAGVPNANSKLHAITHPDNNKHADFQHALHKYSIGAHINKAQRKQLTLYANAIAKEVAQLADVRCFTHHILSKVRQHSASKAQYVLHEEAARVTERSILHALLLCRDYVHQGQATKNEIICHVFISNPNQPRPSITQTKAKYRAFSTQTPLSYITRAMLGGADIKRLTTQHQFVPDIADLVNYLQPSKPLTTDPAILSNPLASRAKAYIRRIFRKESAFVYINVPREAIKNEHSSS
jgi:hypothetical protein